jgi:CheY-like chemotaxis protein
VTGNDYLLLVEDDLSLVELLRHVLADEDSSIRVVHVQDGAEALDYLHARDKFQDREPCNPAVMLLDLKMPKVDGLEVLRQVKGDAHLKTIPVVILTSSKNTGDVLQAYELGANAYVAKPLDFQRFMTSIKQLVTFWMTVNQPPYPANQKMAAAPLTAVKT